MQHSKFLLPVCPRQLKNYTKRNFFSMIILSNLTELINCWYKCNSSLTDCILLVTKSCCKLWQITGKGQPLYFSWLRLWWCVHSRVDTDVLMEVAYRCNFLAVSDSSTCPDIGTSWCHAGIIEHFEIRGFKMTP